MTNDVESFSIPLNREDKSVVKEVYDVGLPRLLDLNAKHAIKSTFYFTGIFTPVQLFTQYPKNENRDDME